MTDPLDVRLAQACRDYLVTQDIADPARQRMHDAQRGQPRSASTGPGGGGGNHSPVEAALDERNYGGDALKESTHNRLDACRLIEAEVQLRRAWAPHEADLAARRSTASTPGMICDQCNKGTVYTRQPTTVGGRLDAPQHLCRGCYDSVGRRMEPRTNKRAGPRTT